MLSTIAAFEARLLLRSPLFLVSAAIFFLLAFGATASDNIRIGSSGEVAKNAPYALLEMVSIMNLFGMFVVTAFVASAVIRDDETGFAPILRATRIGKTSYLLGRFTGASLVAFLVMLTVPLGILVGSAMPWQDPEKILPFAPHHYVYASLVFGLPTILVMSAGLFAVATATRSMMGSYLAVVGLLVVYTVSRIVLAEPQYAVLAGLSDPFALGPLFEVTKYWTVTDRNLLLPPLTGLLLHNRLIWLGVAAASLALAHWRFDMRATTSHAPRKGSGQGRSEPPRPKQLPRPRSGWGWGALWAMTRFDAIYVLRSPAFAVLLVLGAFNALGSLVYVTEMRGVPYFPVTRAVVDALYGAFATFPLLISIYYTGELVWRDRDQRIHEIVDSTSTPNWAFLVPKLIAITLVLLSTLVVAVLGSIGFQAFHGYFHFELGNYLTWFLLPVLISTVQVAVLSTFVQTLVPTKAAGWAVMLGYVVASVALANLGFEHTLYNYGSAASVPLSDMNGMGHFWIARAWHQLYWSAFALGLVVVAHVLWRRGSETRLRPRLALAPSRLRGIAGGVLATSALVWLGSGAFIYHSSNVLNRYITAPERERMQAAAERTLLPLEDLPRPTIVHVDLDVELHPTQRLAITRGSYLLENRGDVPVTQLVVQTDLLLKVEEIELAGATLQAVYEDFGVRIYDLAEPMQPGEQRQMGFVTRRQELGFPNGDAQTRLVGNGSFVDNMEIAPFLGITREGFLRDRARRRKQGLPPDLRPPKLEDERADRRHYLRPDSDWVTADIRLGTDADQTPIAPGMTVSDTIADGRRTVVTRTESPIQNFFSLQSARYEVAEDEWIGPGGKKVALAVYFHPGHDHNVRRMLDAMKVSLALFSEKFSPYQFEQARIVEFPAYADFAQSFANTIPYSEGIGFIQNFSDEDGDEKIDLVTYVTAHEIAHQWWAHQVIGAEKQGMTLLSETFSQYSALLVMEKLYGKAQIRKFLKSELDRYLRARGTEAVEELPLNRVEDQGYVHYNKGAVVMYGLKEIVGEEAVNRALRRLIADFAFEPAPYPDSNDFLRLLRQEVGPEHEQLVVDLFERITLYDLAVGEAKVEALADGRYETRVTIEARKLYADGAGREEEAPLDEAFDVGLFSHEPGTAGFTAEDVQVIERHRLHGGLQEVVLQTDRRPAYAGVDPYNMRIDRNSDDNVVAVVD